MIFGLFSLAIIFVTLFAIFNTSVDIINKYEEKNNLENALSSLEKDEKKLKNEVLKLQDSDYLARYAREKYFYSKEGEWIIRIPDKDE